MNEVTHIHLGRQPYTISVEAHKTLKKYLSDIQKKVADPDVANEVELRMSELLAERGINSEKVILPEDVTYLKQQLGSPDDFGDEESPETPAADDRANRRLFRDSDNAMIAGVASGLASYFGLDVVLVRLIFVLLAIFGGGTGIILYILFWLVVPSATTASEKLQMEGKPVTLEALKDSVSKADISGPAKRINNSILGFLNGVFRIGIKLAGVGFILVGLGIVAFVAMTKMYMILHDGKLFQENLFPVGAREEWLLAITMGMVVIIAIFLALIGVATFKRKWPVRGWITGLLVGIFLVGTTASFALAADAVPRVRERYETSLHTTAVKNIQPFNKVVTAGDIDISYVSSPNYAVNLHYSGHPDISKVKIYVKDNVLYINSDALDTIDHCTMLCLFPRYNMTVQIYAPNVGDFVTPPHTEIFYPNPAALD